MTDTQKEELYAVADFCLIPMGTGESSVAKYIAECQRVLEKLGVHFKNSGYGTNIEGPWNKVMQAIHDCHAAVHAMGAPRIATDIRIGTRIDREIEPGTGNAHKVTRVEQLLAAGEGQEPWQGM
ncbi:MTH1187/YkoF-like protein [Schizopora paradoxa]|uniref:MTH1187/YkoF-like protein n=1 Tax=Schizopora paradoxa TaxID=27342 RepID=A0A0H2SC11_9AGAM|nr:MTH1187/YkoF-like protein [Schizopora paradoxa]